MEMNRINFGKYQIFRYVEELFVAMPELLNPEIEIAMNMEPHGLNEEELKIVLFERFSQHMLVAKSKGRGLFTPTLGEIEVALHEKSDHLYESENTFYGLTTAGLETFKALKRGYGEEN